MKSIACLLVFVSTSVTCAILLAFPFSGLSRAVAIFSLVLGLAAAGSAWWTFKPEGEHQRAGSWDIFLFVVFGLASLRAFFWLIYPAGDEWRVLSPNNLGDLSLHIHLIRYLAGGVGFWPASPILAGVPLSYPLGADLFNSLLSLVGVPVERGLVWVGLAGAALTAAALWRWGGAFAMAALLFNGGLAGFLIFQSGQFADFQSDLAWKNFFLSMFVTQRGLLYALPCGVFLLSCWRSDFFRGGSGIPQALQIFLYASLPLFHVHSFVFLSFVLAGVFLAEKAHRRILLRFVGLAFVPATVAVWFVSGGFSAASGLRWLPGWMQDDGGWVFWVWNFGISLPLLALLAWRCLSRPDPELRSFAGVGLAVLLLGFLVAVAPWAWDNTKLLLWGWIACAPYLWSRVVFPLPRIVRAATCFLLFFSGAVSLVGGLDGRHGYELARRSKLADTEAALRHVAPADCIAIKPTFNHPVMLLGHPVFCGYEGHLWSHGLDYQHHWENLQKVFRREPGWSGHARELDADWLYFDGDPPVVIPLKDAR